MSHTSTYFVLVEYKSGREWIARDPASSDLQSTIDDIAEGQIENVVEVRRAEDWADVTRDVMLAVSTIWAHSGEALNYERYSAVEQHLGTRAARSFVRSEVA